MPSSPAKNNDIVDLCTPPPSPSARFEKVKENLSPTKGVRFVKPKGESTVDEDCYIVELQVYQLKVDPDIKVVLPEEDTRTILRENRVTSSNPNDDDLLVIGTQGTNVLADCPHARFSCVLEAFKEGNFEHYCDNCYCWLCEVPAKDCKRWKLGKNGKKHNAHCRANSKEEKWIKKKEGLQAGTLKKSKTFM